MHPISNGIIPEFTSLLASSCGLPADTVNSTLQTSSATILTNLASKAQFSYFLTSSVKRHWRIRHVGRRSCPAFSQYPVRSYLPAVESAIAEADGIPADAAIAVLASAAPLVLHAIGDSINASGSTLASLESTLAAELPSLKNYLPESFVIPVSHAHRT